MLRQDLDAPRKQRHTALRIRDRLIEEHQVEVTYSTVRDYVREARPRIAAEAGRQLAEVFVPQTHPAGAEAEVDFADLWIVWAGVKTKVFLFTLRLSYSGKAIHRAYATASQEAFLDGHRYAFEQLGGIPTVHIRYDNLKAAVSRVLTGRTRVESDRWVLFRSHYGFDVFYCRPGVEGAHEKGGVEGEGGRFRRTHTVPMPKVESLAELNAYLAKCDAKDDHRRVGQRSSLVGDDFAVEQVLLRPLPAEPFETGLSLRPRVDRHARVTVRQCQYSVPVRYVGRQLRVLLSVRPAFRCSTAPGWSLNTNAPRSAAASRWCWTTTSRCWPTSPGRCPVRPLWSRPARPGRSPQSTSGTGRRRRPATATRPAPKPWSKPCCCTVSIPTARSWPASRPRSPSVPSAPKPSPWRSDAPGRPGPSSGWSATTATSATRPTPGPSQPSTPTRTSEDHEHTTG